MNIKRIVTNKIKSSELNINLREWEDIIFFDDKIMLENSWYKEIFGRKYKSDNYYPSKRGIVKIKVKCEKPCIFRMFYSGNSHTLNNEEIALTTLSLQQLGIDLNNKNKDFIKIILSKGSKHKFYYCHPQHYVRVAYKLALLSLVLGLISIITSFISFIT